MIIEISILKIVLIILAFISTNYAVDFEKSFLGENYRYEGSRLDISFTAKYVTEAIKASGSEEITIGFNGDMKAFVIRNKEDKTALQLVLPVRTY